jgi:hypothetical protein
MRDDVLLSVYLVLVGLLLTGCMQPSQAGEPATVTPRPAWTPSGIAQAGELEDLVDVNECLEGLLISELQVNGDVALAIAEKDGRTRIIAINLRGEEVAGLDMDTPLSASNQWPTSERYFVWTTPEAPDDPTEDLHVYDIRTGEEFRVEGEGLSQCCADVSGDIVVWSEIHAGRGGDIYAYDISSGELIPVVTRPLGQSYPKVEGDWVIYLEKRDSDPRNPMQDLYLHNLTTGEDMLIGPSPYAAQLEGDTYGIDNGRVVWKGWAIGEKPTSDGPPPSLHIYDLETRTESVLDLSPVCASVPVSFRMAGDLILFSCEGFYGCYDLARGSFFSVPHPEHWSGYTYLSETYVVFRVAEEGESFWDYMTPGASPMPPEEHWLTPQPARFRLFVVPITR